MGGKLWSYEAITEKAEGEIRGLMARAAEEKDEDGRRLFRQWAYGVYLGWRGITLDWRTLTMEWQESSDADDRIEALTRVPK